MTSIRNFFFFLDEFLPLLNAEQRYFIENDERFAKFNFSVLIADDQYLNDFFSDFLAVSSYSFNKDDYKDISELVVIISYCNNYMEPVSSNFDSYFSHPEASSNIFNSVGHEGINLDKFDIYMLGDMIYQLFNIDL